MCTCLLICCPGGRGETSQPAELEEMARAANPEEIDIDDDEEEDEMEGERPGGTLAGHQYVVGGGVMFSGFRCFLYCDRKPSYEKRSQKYLNVDCRISIIIKHKKKLEQPSIIVVCDRRFGLIEKRSELLICTRKSPAKRVILILGKDIFYFNFFF